MKIEIGKFYRGENDRKCMVLNVEESRVMVAFPLRGPSEGLWETGLLFDSDLKEEWFDKPTIDRKVLPAWHKWAAMDENREWYSFINQPNFKENRWNDDDTTYLRIPPPFAPIWNGKPEDSLIELDNQTV